MRKVIIALGAMAALGLTATACSTTSATGAQQAENRQQQQAQASLQQAQPLPHFNFSQIRQTLIDAETISAQGAQTTSFFFNLGDLDPVFSCPSIGMPIAANAELSNPLQAVDGGNSQGYGITSIGQMDPNGIYSSPSTAGTYVICVLNNGQKYLAYWEGNVWAVTGEASWDYGHHSATVTGAPTYALKTAGG